MFISAIRALLNRIPAQKVNAHCDGPCGVYDPASARIAAEAVLSMTKKLLALEPPQNNNQADWATYNNTFARFVAIKEDQAKETKEELLILWTDYFKPEHLTTFPDLHETFWKAAKLCSACKVNVDQSKAEELMESVEKIHHMFWKSKGRNDAWTTAR